MNKAYVMRQLRRALELFVQTITDESVMREVADIYPEWEVGKAYRTDDNTHIFRYGVNSDGETQLYLVLQNHIAQAQYTPDTATSLYKAIGVTADGTLEWTQPLGATDAYDKGDVVVYNGVKYRSTYDGKNVWVPGVYGWEEVTE